jgi:hypothetical protein
MSLLIRPGVLAVAIATALSLLAVSATDPAGRVEKPVAVEELKKGLMSALGDSFEYLGGEVGRTDARAGGWGAERFWFARVRPKRAGEFALSYTITFDFPAGAGGFGPLPDKAEYILPIKVGNRHAPRLIHPPGSWGSSTVNRPLTQTRHGLFAYLEFKKPGEFNLSGRLADAEEKAAGGGVSFRVLPGGKPVTVCLEYFEYKEHVGKSTSRSSGSVGPGTLEVRVGDRVLIGCGGYITPAQEKPEEYRTGVVVVRPFQVVPSYAPEPKE